MAKKSKRTRIQDDPAKLFVLGIMLIVVGYIWPLIAALLGSFMPVAFLTEIVFFAGFGFWVVGGLSILYAGIQILRR